MKWILSFLIVASFSGSSCQQYPQHKLNEKQQLVNEVRRKVALQLKKEKGLCPCGIGSQMMNQIEMLALSFDYYRPIEIEEGRELLITAVNEFVAAVNAEQRMRPYLNHYPFLPKNVEIRIFLRNPDNSDIALGQLSVISALEGVLKYKIDDPSTNLFKTVHEETYDEALLKLNASRLALKERSL